MLVLSRKIGEKVVIGDEVTVTVLEIQGGKIKLGFEGPGHIPIHRQEVQAQIDHWVPAMECVACH